MGTETEFLKELLRRSSPTGAAHDAVAFAADWCRRNGMEAHDNDGILYVNPKSSDLLLLGHIDTVPGDIEVREEDGKIWGRGAADAKGPLSAAIVALKRNPSLADKVCLVGVPDEEGDSQTAYGIRDAWKERPTVILEPSTWEGITLSYNGRLQLRCVKFCPPSHSGHNSPFANEELATIWNDLRDRAICRIMDISGNATEAVMILDVRYRDMTPDEIVIQVSQRCQLNVMEQVLPYRADKGSSLVRAFSRAVRESGGKTVFKNKSGTSDMNVLGEKWAAPMLAYGPGDGNLGHTDDEHISVDGFFKGIEVYERAMKHFLGMDES